MGQIVDIGRRVIVAVLMLIASGAVFSQEKAAVDYRAKETRLVQINDTSVVKLVGDVFLIHNGAIISCDTAYRYSERRFEAFGNVIINQDSIYIYGDKVVYNGETDIARVLSELIKVVDGDVTMYTREMYFNTRNRIGYFSKGATLKQGTNNMEAISGEYDSENKLITLNEKVAMENEEYLLKTNALKYNQNTQVANFNTLTNIWNVKGEYLQADKGRYEQLGNIYHFEKNSYILTKDQECWSDSLIYFSDINEVELKRNIQINDTVQMASTFGDYGYFWNVSRRVLMTKRPSALSYDVATRDTVYVSADTIIVAPILERSNMPDTAKIILDTLPNKPNEELAEKVESALKSTGAMPPKRDSITNDKVDTALDSIKMIEKERTDSIRKQNLLDSLPPAARRDTILKWNKLPSFIPLYNNAQLDSMNIKERKRADKRMKRYEKRFDKELKRYLNDNLYLEKLEKEKELADSLAKKPVVEPTPPAPVEKEIRNTPDSSDMVITAYLNAKVYRYDMQSIADTMVVETVDSTTTSIGSPLAWNMGNQIIAGRIRSYVRNGSINRTRMFNKPIMIQRIEEDMYNQMKGETMDALYRNSAIYRLVVTGNAMGRMYREEPEEVSKVLQIVAFITSSSKNMIIDMDSSRIERVKWVGETETTTYSMNEIPKDKLKLDGFKWVPELRPTKSDVFNRKIRPSVRMVMERVQKPNFAITNQIMRDRKRLIESGVWVDRNDKLKVNREELIKQSQQKIVQ